MVVYCLVHSCTVFYCVVLCTRVASGYFTVVRVRYTVRSVLYCLVWSCVVLCCLLLSFTVLYGLVLYCVTLYCVVLCTGVASGYSSEGEVHSSASGEGHIQADLPTPPVKPSSPRQVNPMASGSGSKIGVTTSAANTMTTSTTTTVRPKVTPAISFIYTRGLLSGVVVRALDW